MNDAIIVLGYELTSNGELETVSKGSVKKAISLYKAGVAPRIIFSGSRRYSSKRLFKTSEARQMMKFALSLGVPKKAILIEDEAKDTIGNAYFTMIRHLEPNNWKNIVVVSSDFHMPRVEYIFNKFLGNKYSVSFVSSNSGLSAADYQDKWFEDQEITLRCHQWLEGIPDGDLPLLTDFITKRHPAYRKIFSLTTL